MITWLWIVGLTNAYNFMDGSDGMAGSQAVIAGLGWACLGWLADFPLLADLSLLLAVGSLGFLPHNWPPARIFMGDVGSAFLGYSFAVLPLLGLRAGGPLASLSPILGLLLRLAVCLRHRVLTFLRRLRRGENVLAAHRSHLYQRLIIAGYSHRFVLLLYSGLAIIGAGAAIFWLRHPSRPSGRASLCCHCLPGCSADSSWRWNGRPSKRIARRKSCRSLHADAGLLKPDSATGGRGIRGLLTPAAPLAWKGRGSRPPAAGPRPAMAGSRKARCAVLECMLWAEIARQAAAKLQLATAADVICLRKAHGLTLVEWTGFVGQQIRGCRLPSSHKLAKIASAFSDVPMSRGVAFL